MDEANTDVWVFLGEMVGKMLCTVYRAVLASCAAEADHQTGESSFAVCLDMRIDDSVDMLQKTEHLTVILKELNDRLVASSQFLIWFISSRIVDRSAVKDIPSSVSRRIIRHPFLE